MDASGHQSAPPSLLRRTWRIALLAVAASLAATHFLAARMAPGPGREAVATLRGVVEPETTGSIAGPAARTRLDPCGVPSRP
ncbi:hypothetical protein DA075_21475 [Methylobacterium currus]|uniref:Uncharacterized protein n=1 Tax=Methylobacterium currus TaxID=2051553 RepID=A0A2R4WNS0_9HYPH|nr:hypothetical protein [Methylobacterium currus]AWB23155.1 hypothetical protein DA075_21475 [Methylobacterium currus]